MAAPVVLTRLLILWLLSEGPLHGYRVKKILDDQSLSFWFPVEYASIYSVLKSLVKKGYVKVIAVERDGRRPERTRYAISPSGRKHLVELLAQAWRELPSPADPFQLALAARSELTVDQVNDLNAERIGALQARMGQLGELARSAPAPEMVERLVALTSAELTWLKALLENQGGAGNGSAT